MEYAKDLVKKWFPSGGYFVEAGAHDGVGDSQTKELEDTGKWTGICVEPSSAFHSLAKSRICQVDPRPLYRVSGVIRAFREIHGEAVELSGLEECFQNDMWDRKYRPHSIEQMYTISLTDLLKEYNASKVIQYLALDTEGSEYEILRGHDFDQFDFLTINAEHNGVLKVIDALKALLGDEYYIVFQTEVELFFAKRGVPS